jgi:hypothetical protein
LIDRHAIPWVFLVVLVVSIIKTGLLHTPTRAVDPEFQDGE